VRHRRPRPLSVPVGRIWDHSARGGVTHANRSGVGFSVLSIL
jgi:hypothetical protein